MAAMATTPSLIVVVVNSTSSKSNGPSSLSGWSTALGLCTIAIGTIGVVANLLEQTQIWHKQKKKKKKQKTVVDLLIINQKVLDAIACLFLCMSYTLKQTQIVLSGSLGEWLCALFYSDTVIWIGLTGSSANQVLVAFLLYFEAKHVSLYKKLFRRKWSTCFFVALTWIDGALNNPFALERYVKDGVCYSTGLWTTTAGHVAFGAWTFVWDYLLPIASTAYCYGSIVTEVRRRTKTASPPAPPISSHSTTNDHRTRLGAHILRLYKTNCVNARVAHLVLFGVFWCPCHICLLILSWSSQDIQLNETYTAGLCLGCLQISLLGSLINATVDGRLTQRVQAVVTTWCSRHIGRSRPQINGDNGERREEEGSGRNSEVSP